MVEVRDTALTEDVLAHFGVSRRGGPGADCLQPGGPEGECRDAGPYRPTGARAGRRGRDADPGKRRGRELTLAAASVAARLEMRGERVSICPGREHVPCRPVSGRRIADPPGRGRAPSRGQTARRRAGDRGGCARTRRSEGRRPTFPSTCSDTSVGASSERCPRGARAVPEGCQSGVGDRSLQIRIFSTSRDAARTLSSTVAREVERNPHLVLGLPTGRTPFLFYRELTGAHRRGRIDFSGVTTFNLDEFIGIAAVRRPQLSRVHAAAPVRPRQYRARRIHFLDGWRRSSSGVPPLRTGHRSGPAAST